jgi:hypothetical protein
MLTCQAARRSLRVPDVRIEDPLVLAYVDFAHDLQSFIDGFEPAGSDVPTTGLASSALTEGSR